MSLILSTPRCAPGQGHSPREAWGSAVGPESFRAGGCLLEGAPLSPGTWPWTLARSTLLSTEEARVQQNFIQEFSTTLPGTAVIAGGVAKSRALWQG